MTVKNWNILEFSKNSDMALWTPYINTAVDVVRNGAIVGIALLLSQFGNLVAETLVDIHPDERLRIENNQLILEKIYEFK